MIWEIKLTIMINYSCEGQPDWKIYILSCSHSFLEQASCSLWTSWTQPCKSSPMPGSYDNISLQSQPPPLSYPYAHPTSTTNLITIVSLGARPSPNHLFGNLNSYRYCAITFPPHFLLLLFVCFIVEQAMITRWWWLLVFKCLSFYFAFRLKFIRTLPGPC